MSLVRKDEATQELLDYNKSSEDSITIALGKNLSKIMNSDVELYESIKNIVGEEHINSTMKKILNQVGKPPVLLKQVLLIY